MKKITQMFTAILLIALLLFADGSSVFAEGPSWKSWKNVKKLSVFGYENHFYALTGDGMVLTDNPDFSEVSEWKNATDIGVVNGCPVALSESGDVLFPNTLIESCGINPEEWKNVKEIINRPYSTYNSFFALNKDGIWSVLTDEYKKEILFDGQKLKKLKVGSGYSPSFMAETADGSYVSEPYSEELTQWTDITDFWVADLYCGPIFVGRRTDGSTVAVSECTFDKYNTAAEIETWRNIKDVLTTPEIGHIVALQDDGTVRYVNCEVADGGYDEHVLDFSNCTDVASIACEKSDYSDFYCINRDGTVADCISTVLGEDISTIRNCTGVPENIEDLSKYRVVRTCDSVLNTGIVDVINWHYNSEYVDESPYYAIALLEDGTISELEFTNAVTETGLQYSPPN